MPALLYNVYGIQRKIYKQTYTDEYFIQMAQGVC